MKFYNIETAEINKVVGSIASHHMSSSYNYGTPQSIRNLKSLGKMGFIPDFDSIQVLPRAKLMDMIHSIPIASRGLIISDKLLDLINRHSLPEELEVFDVNVTYIDQDFHYNYFYLYKSWEHDYIDFQKTTFFETNSVGLIDKELDINSYSDFQNAIDSSEFGYIEPKRIFLKENIIKYDIFRFAFIGTGYFVSEKLKEKIQSENCQGIEFTEIKNLKTILTP